jgi:hypothetical protein
VADAPPAAAGVACSACGHENVPGAQLCAGCGKALPQPGHFHAELALVREFERHGPLAAIFVFVVCALVAVIAWYPLDLPARVIRLILPSPSCFGEAPGSAGLFLCSTGVSFLEMVGPLAVMLAIFLARVPLRALLGRAIGRLPEELRFLVAPVFATMLFAISWAGFHSDATSEVGLLPQILFPGLVGLLTFLVTRYEHGLQGLLRALLEARDRVLPRWARILVVVGLTTLASWAFTHQDAYASTALKEQLVVIISLLVGWLALVPRGHGTLA